MRCRARPAASLPFSECADRSHTRDSQPKQKDAEKQSKNCTCKTVNKIEQSGFLLGSSLKQNRSDAAYELYAATSASIAPHKIDKTASGILKKDRAIGNTQAASKKRSPVRGTKGDKPHNLTHQTQSPAPHDFK